MKLVIEIPNEVVDKESYVDYFGCFSRELYEIIKNGTPLNEVLDKIGAEIEQLTLTEGGEDYIRKMAELCSLKFKVLQIIDKYREDGYSDEELDMLQREWNLEASSLEY